MKIFSILPVLAVFLAAAAGAGCTQFFKYPDNVGPKDGVTDSEDDTGDTQDDDVSDVQTDDTADDQADDPTDDQTDVQVDDASDVEVEPGDCGDGNVDDGEQCDDGNDIAGDGCENDCTWTCEENAECRDEEICNGEEVCNTDSHMCQEADDLDDGFVCADDPRSICLDGICEESECGDGFVDTGGGEGCEPPDEGNCNSDCQIECEDNEDCLDDGNACNGEEFCDMDAGECSHRDPLEDGTECGSDPRRICISETCQESVCGDSFSDPGADPAEECDDGDTVEGDGCDNDCMYSCHEETQEIECDDELGCTLDVCNTSTHVCDNHTMVDGTVCRTAADLCDAVETCNGTDTACPSDGHEPDSHVCREADGDCDAAETCTGDSMECPGNGYLDNTFECRGEVGGCDLPESCTGEGPDCPTDEFLAHTVECRESAGDCDVAEDCPGDGPACPANGFLPGSTVCRASAGDCDIVENCPGDGAGCPTDAFRPGTFECRAAANTCDLGENCPGDGAACGEDLFVDSGVGCDDDDDCTVDTTCDGDGNCAGSHLTELMNVTSVALGYNHVCALSTGKMKCWGRNNSGQLGDASATDRHSPVEVPGLASAPTAIGAGGDHTCAVLDTGAVQCWGENGDGQLGDGTTGDKNSPTDVTGLATGATDVSAGSGHTCALLAGGGVKCWGDGDFGQMGNGALDSQTTPVDVTGLGSASAISAGRYHTCALVSGGVKCWGRNGNGQLGNGLTENSSTPVDVTGLGSGVSAVSAGSEHTCARLDTGAMKCWGRGSTGRLGDGSGDQHETPVDVSGMSSSVTSISAGNAHTCAIHDTEGVKCWGWNSRGEVGDGTSMTRTTPVGVYNMGAGTSSSIFTGTETTCAIMASSKLKCWGNNYAGQLGIGATSRITTPTTVAGISATVSMVGAADESSCATNSDGFFCWGSNEWWLLADGTQLNSTAPTSVPGLSSDVIDFSGLSSHVCAVKDVVGDGKGAALCWGRNHKGQLGDGTTDDRSSPTQVSGLTDHIRSISAGGYHTCALVDTDSDTIGGAKCWGYNFDGELGDGSGSDQHNPVDVSGMTEANGVLDVQAGHVHTCALTDEGGVKCWGYGNDGRIGNGSTDHQATPVDVTGLTSGVSAIAVGESHACALLTTGQVLCWGKGTSGQLGTGSGTSSSTPVQPWGYDSGIASIEAGNNHNCAILDTGVTQCWGRNTGGQLGDGTTSRRLYPVDMVGLPETPTAIAGGVNHTCARFSSGAAMCWGEDYSGETTGFFPGYPRFVSCD